MWLVIYLGFRKEKVVESLVGDIQPTNENGLIKKIGREWINSDYIFRWR